MKLQGKKILVTGADGFIGSHLTEYLVGQGANVRAFVYYNSFNSWGWLDETDARIKRGVEFWNQNAEALARAEKDYGVPAQYIVAIIGVETFFGRNTGNYRVMDALSTLAFDYPPRADFFRKELKQFLLLAREQQVDPLGLNGSYAGAMGLPQFMPSSFRAYAVDFDGDGHINIWTDPTDAIGSVASYFKQHGWQAGEPVVSQAELSMDSAQDAITQGLEPQMSLGQLRAAYTLATEHSPLPLALHNGLAVPIRVRLHVDAPPGMNVTDIGQIELPPGYLPLRIPVEVNFTQRVAVDATLRTPDGLRLGEPVRLSVHSNAYGKVLFAITLSAAAVLILLAGRRLWHRFRGQPDRADLDRPDPPDARHAAESGDAPAHRPAGSCGHLPDGPD